MSIIIDETGRESAVENFIKDGSTATFKTDVLDASYQVPVLVDFWAPWCNPCKALIPLLEKHVNLAGGSVRLVKINVEQNQQIAAQLRVQSVPTVIAFKDGKPVDAFVGGQSETEIRDFIGRVGGTGNDIIEITLNEAEYTLDKGDAERALSLFTKIHEKDDTNTRAISGIIKCLAAQGLIDEAKNVVSSVPVKLLSDAGISSAVKALELAEKINETESVKNLQKRLELNPDDMQTRFDLAIALYAENSREDAVDNLLEIIRTDREWNEQAARKQLVSMFEVFGANDPLTVSSRRKLSSILFS